MRSRGLAVYTVRYGSALSIAGLTLVLSMGCASTPPSKSITPITTPSATISPAQPGQSGAAAKAATTTPEAAADTTSASAGGTAKKKKPFKSPLLAKSFEEAVAHGDEAWVAGDVEMAIYQYVQALSFRPRDVTTLSKLGVIEQNKGNLDLAVRALELAAKANPDDVRVTARLGLIYLALGQDDNARTWLQRSARTSSHDWRVYDALGVLEERHGDNAAALQHLQQALTLAPGAPTPLLHRGQAMLSTGDYAGAESSVRAALTHENTPEAWQLLGQIQAKRRDYADSLNSMLQALDAPAAYNTVAKSALDNGDNAVALNYFEKASELSPVYLPETEHNAAIARGRLDSASH